MRINRIIGTIRIIGILESTFSNSHDPSFKNSRSFSDGNATCSFSYKFNGKQGTQENQQTVVLWVYYAEPAIREMGINKFVEFHYFIDSAGYTKREGDPKGEGESYGKPQSVG